MQGWCSRETGVHTVPMRGRTRSRGHGPTDATRTSMCTASSAAATVKGEPTKRPTTTSCPTAAASSAPPGPAFAHVAPGSSDSRRFACAGGGCSDGPASPSAASKLLTSTTRSASVRNGSSRPVRESARCTGGRTPTGRGLRALPALPLAARRAAHRSASTAPHADAGRRGDSTQPNASAVRRERSPMCVQV
jgi:hypothetical protein